MNKIADVHFACNSRKFVTRFFFPPEGKMQEQVIAFGMTVAQVVLHGLENRGVHKRTAYIKADKETDKYIFIVSKQQFAHIRFAGC